MDLVKIFLSVKIWLNLFNDFEQEVISIKKNLKTYILFILIYSLPIKDKFRYNISLIWGRGTSVFLLKGAQNGIKFPLVMNFYKGYTLINQVEIEDLSWTHTFKYLCHSVMRALFTEKLLHTSMLHHHWSPVTARLATI